MRMVSGQLQGRDLTFDYKQFEQHSLGTIHKKRYVLVQHERLQFPICVFEHPNQQFTAVWMKCSHQGAELQVFGDKLQCPAHGSEFDSQGNPLNPPADMHLRTFPVNLKNELITIHLQ